MREISCEQLKERMNEFRLVDVRTPEEYTGELGHIAGTELRPLGPELLDFLKTLNPSENIVFVCRSGARSGQTTLLSEEMGFTSTYNMVGGMLRWNEMGFAVTKGAGK
ncbi:rhodanese-like domain-containing protein [Bdellovibrio bacteriovorus]|uniref:rhodanese-like domain-containing protein n=1 Tax=Bdellovibrio bacteriovorus TaxID=959 RepID=UPI003AA86823